MFVEHRRKFPKKESSFIKDYMKRLKMVVPDIFYFKSHGQPMQVRGIPDIVACINGHFVGLEFKIMRGSKFNLTPYQDDTMIRVIKAGGRAFVVWYDENNQDIGVQTTRFTSAKYTEAVDDSINFLLQSVLQSS